MARYYNINVYEKDGVWFAKVTQKGKIAAWEQGKTQDAAIKAARAKADAAFGGDFPPTVEPKGE